MKTLTLLALAFFYPLLSSAAEATRWHESRAGVVDFWLKRSEEGRIYLEHFRAPPGKLQVLLERKSYDHPALAERVYSHLTKGWSRERPARFETRNGLATEVRGDSIWPTTREWNPDWESKFSAWVHGNVDAHFMEKYKIATDCADVAVALRWIFARIHGLPAADHLMGTGQLFGNESMRSEWASLPAGGEWSTDPRFRAALDYILIHTYTHSIMTDLYPVKIDGEGVGPGAVLLHLYDEETGHTEVIRWAGPGQANAIQMVASTVPREVRELADYGIQDWGYPPERRRDGLFRFLWPVRRGTMRTLEEPANMPLFSLEQYAADFTKGYANWTDAVIAKAVPDFSFNPKLALRARAEELKQRLLTRVKVVEDGYAYCSVNGCPEGSGSWETWSTPSRDRAIGRLVTVVDEIYAGSSCYYSCRRELDARRGEQVTVIGKPYMFGDALGVWEQEKFSSNPNDSVAVRWGW